MTNVSESLDKLVSFALKSKVDDLLYTCIHLKYDLHVTHVYTITLASLVLKL